MLVAMAATAQAATTFDWGSHPPPSEAKAIMPLNWTVVPPTDATPPSDGTPGRLDQLWPANDVFKTVLVAWKPSETSFTPSSSVIYSDLWAEQTIEGAVWAMDWIDITSDSGSPPAQHYYNLPDAVIPLDYNYVFLSFALTHEWGLINDPYNDGNLIPGIVNSVGSVQWQSRQYTAAELQTYMYFPEWDSVNNVYLPGPLLTLYPSWGAVPEPAAGLLALAGASILLLRRRARKA